MVCTFCFQHFPPTTGILPILFNRKANNCFDFPAIFRPTKPQLNWNENQILMKQTMKRHRADWWRKDPTGGGIFILQFSFCFSFAHNPLFLFWVLHCRCSRCYFKCFLFAVFRLSVFPFCFLFFVFQWIEWGTHYLHTHTHTPGRPFPPPVGSHESTFIKCKPFHSLLCKFSFIFLCSSFNLRFRLPFLQWPLAECVCISHFDIL